MKRKQQQARELMVAMRDENGNTLAKWSDGTVTLQLRSEGKRERKLGLIKDDIFYTKRTSAHYHYKSKSYGFNYFLIKYSSFNWIMLELEDGVTYKIPKHIISNFGKVMYFKFAKEQESFELQIFLSFGIIQRFRYYKEGETKIITDDE